MSREQRELSLTAQGNSMSKASDFVKSVKARPTFGGVSYHENKAYIDDAGNLVIVSVQPFKPGDALAFAEWIVKTFKDDDEARKKVLADLPF